MSGKKHKTLAIKNKCGKIVDEPPCSEIFKQNYTLNDFRAILFYRSKDYRFHEIFDDFPRDKENKKEFEQNYFDNFAKGLLEYVGDSISRKEKSDEFFHIDNLKGYVLEAVNRFFKELRRDVQNYHEITVNNDIITELRLLLSAPNLTIRDLVPLTKKRLSIEQEKLLLYIKELPGYRNCWFKLRRENKDKKLIMFIKEEDIIEKYNFVTMQEKEETINGKNTGSSPLEERFENFFRVLNKLERCVYKHRIKQSYSLNEVATICWNKPVTIANVDHVINNIIKKVKNTFLGSGYDKRN